MQTMTTAEEKIAKRRADMPEIRRGTYDRAMSGKSRPSGVRAMCQMCVGWEDISNGVRNCTDPACPLFPYRPHRR